VTSEVHLIQFLAQSRTNCEGKQVGHLQQWRLNKLSVHTDLRVFSSLTRHNSVVKEGTNHCFRSTSSKSRKLFSYKI